MDYGRYGGHTGFVWPRLTPAVRLLLIVNVAVFVANAIVQGALIPWLGVSWSKLWEGYGLGLVRLVTSQFVHSWLDAFHLLFNMLFLYFFGTFVEEAIGKRHLLRLYLAAGVVGGIMHVLLGRIMQSDSVAVGASGAVYGILVYAACMAPRMTVILIVFPIPLWLIVSFLVGYGAYSMYVEMAAGVTSGVAHGGHLGGALWGFLAYRLPRREWAWTARLRGWQQERQQRASSERQAVLDQLLDKVHREGIGSLTPAERRFLDKTSQQMRRK